MATAAIAAPVSIGQRTLPIACAVVVVLHTFVVSIDDASPATYAVTSRIASWFAVSTGVALMTAGAITAIVRPRGSIAPVTASLGAVWLAPDWFGWVDGPSAARTLAMLMMPLAVPLLAHLVLAYPSGRIDRRAASAFVVLTYAAAAGVVLCHALFRDPFLDLRCLANCADNVFLVRSDPVLVETSAQIWLPAAAFVCVLTGAAGAWRLANATRVARRSMWFVLIPATFAALGFAAYAVLLMPDGDDDPSRTSFRSVFFVRAVALLAVSIGIVWGVWRAHRTERAVRRLVDEFGASPPPGSLRSVLARSLGDEGLSVAYWLPSTGQYVDATGHTIDPVPVRGQISTAIVRDGQPIAVVLHDAALAPQAEIGAAARLAVDNERLQAEVLAQLADLRASQARIVSTADSTRRRLERDLHDGAQQRLLAATYELRLAHSEATATGNSALATVLTTAFDEAQSAITELRAIAHGIFPAILSEAGLEPALRLLADRARLPVELGEIDGRRYAEDVETTAYLVVATTIDAIGPSATYVALAVGEHGGKLVVDMASDADLPGMSSSIVDRVGALDGRLAAKSKSLRLEMPCASS